MRHQWGDMDECNLVDKADRGKGGARGKVRLHKNTSYVFFLSIGPATSSLCLVLIIYRQLRVALRVNNRTLAKTQHPNNRFCSAHWLQNNPLKAKFLRGIGSETWGANQIYSNIILTRFHFPPRRLGHVRQ